MIELVSLPLQVKILLCIVVAAVVSFASTPLVKRLAYKIGAVDVPKDNRRMHDHPIPRLGGLAIAVAFLLTVLLFVKMDLQLQGILLGSLLILVLGILDDCLTLDAKPKLVVQLVAAIIVVAHGNVIQNITNPFSAKDFDLGFLGPLVTVIWIVTITNAVNFIDGLDGLAVGVSGLSTASMMAIALLVGEDESAVLLAALLGACLGFIPYNFNPAKIFMGDTGATFLGFILASISVQGLFKMYTVVSFVVPFLILGVPFFDICFAVIRRLLKHKSPMAADREHLHHRLIDMGFSQKQTVAITYMLTVVLGLAAVVLTSSAKMKYMILICAFVVVAIVAIMVIFGPNHRPNHHNDVEKEDSGKVGSHK